MPMSRGEWLANSPSKASRCIRFPAMKLLRNRNFAPWGKCRRQGADGVMGAAETGFKEPG